jgi:FkbM family methyltransferase
MSDAVDRAKDDQPFRHYTLRHQVISWVSRTWFDDLTYTVRHGPLRGMKRKGGLGWIPRIGNKARRTPEQAFLENLAVAGQVIFDVGAFEGLITLFFARKAHHVVCYEPSSRNYARLCQNLELNGVKNVIARKYGVGANVHRSLMASDPRMAGGATLSGNISATIRRLAGAHTEQIEITTLDEDLAAAHLPEPDLIKIDVEGYELAVLQGAKHLLESKHPALYLEMHGETMSEKRANVKALVTHLKSHGYQDILHVESRLKITQENCERASEGHLYCL